MGIHLTRDNILKGSGKPDVIPKFIGQNYIDEDKEVLYYAASLSLDGWKELKNYTQPSNVSVKEFGAVGDGITDDTISIQDAYDYAKSINGTVFFPPGKYMTTKPIKVYSYVSTTGASRDGVIILCNHNSEVFDFPINSIDGESYTKQGGSTVFESLTIMREVRPTGQIAGNYAIKLYGTFGVTIFRDLEIRNMGDSAIYQNDDQLTGTGPIHFLHSRAVSNWYGYGIDMNGTFANIYIDGFHSWGNAGGYSFKAVSSSTVPSQLISISNVDAEYIGGYVQGSDLLPSGNYTGNGVYAENVRSLSITNGSTLQMSRNNGDIGFGREKHCVFLKNCHNVFIEKSCDLTQRMGSLADGVYINKDCTGVTIDGATIYGDNTGRYSINVEADAKQVAIINPATAGFNPNYVNINGTEANPIYIRNGNVDGFLKESYNGSFLLLNERLLNKNVALLDSSNWFKGINRHRQMIFDFGDPEYYNYIMNHYNDDTQDYMYLAPSTIQGGTNWGYGSATRWHADGTFQVMKDAKAMNYYTSTDNTNSIGSPTHRFANAYIVNPIQTSDAKYKKGIRYVKSDIGISPLNLDSAHSNADISYQDMYKFVKNDLEIAKYIYKRYDNVLDKDGNIIDRVEVENSKEDYQIGFIAQDVINTSIGSEFVYDIDGGLSFSSNGFISVVAGALKDAISKIETLQVKVNELEDKLSSLNI